VDEVAAVLMHRARAHVAEDRDLLVGAQRVQVEVPEPVDALAVGDAGEGIRILLDGEDAAAALREADAAALPHAVAAEDLVGEEHDLQRRAAAPDRRGEVREDRVPPFGKRWSSRKVYYTVW